MFIPTPHSSHFAGFEYIPKEERLYVVFKRKNMKYCYKGVPKEIYEAFYNSIKKTEFFVKYIKNSYLYERVL